MKINNNFLKPNDWQISISKARIKDAPDFINMMNSHYERKKEESYFRWQYFSKIKSIYLLAKTKNQVIGGCGIQIVPIQAKKKIYIAKILDFIVKKEYRGTPVAFKLTEAAESWCLNSKMNKFFPSEIKALIITPNKAGNAFFSRYGFTSIPIHNYILENYHLVKKVKPQIKLNTPPKIINFIKDKNYLKWRFKENPEYDYQFITDTKHQGYVVSKTFKDPNDGTLYGDIVDLSLPINQALTEELLKKAILSFKKETRIKKITIWLDPANILLNFLEKYNFRLHPLERFFCIKLLDKKYPEILNLHNWFLAESDSEVY